MKTRILTLFITLFISSDFVASAQDRSGSQRGSDNGTVHELPFSYKGRTIYSTPANKLMMGCGGTNVLLCDFDSMVDASADSSSLSYSLSLDDSVTLIWNFSLTSCAKDEHNSDRHIASSKIVWTVSESQLLGACADEYKNAETADETVFDKVLMNKEDLFKVYPNPAQDHVKIQWPPKVNNWDKASFVFVLYDITGVEVKKFRVQEEITELDIQNLPAGNYLYKVFLNDETTIEYNKGMLTIQGD